MSNRWYQSPLVWSKDKRLSCRICGKEPVRCRHCYKRFCEGCSTNRGRCEGCQRPLSPETSNQIHRVLAGFVGEAPYGVRESFLAKWFGVPKKEVRRAARKLLRKLGIRKGPRGFGSERAYYARKDAREED